MRVWSLDREDPLEEGVATHSSILAWRIPMDRRACWATELNVFSKSWTRLKGLNTHARRASGVLSARVPVDRACCPSSSASCSHCSCWRPWCCTSATARSTWPPWCSPWPWAGPTCSTTPAASSRWASMPSWSRRWVPVPQSSSAEPDYLLGVWDPAPQTPSLLSALSGKVLL